MEKLEKKGFEENPKKKDWKKPQLKILQIKQTFLGLGDYADGDGGLES